MVEGRLVDKPDKKKALYEITDAGTDYLRNPPEEIKPEEPETTTVDKSSGQEHPAPLEPDKAVPSKSELFRGIGERLGVGARKGDIRLDSIIYYVERKTNINDLTSVWNT